MSFNSRCKDLFSPLHLKQPPPPAGSRDGRTWPPTPPPSQRAAADPGPKHGENPVPCKETKPEIKIVRITAFTTTTSLHPPEKHDLHHRGQHDLHLHQQPLLHMEPQELTKLEVALYNHSAAPHH